MKIILRLWKKPLIEKTSPLYPWIVLLGAIISTDMAIIAAVAESLANPHIQGFFAIGETRLAWIGTIFLLALVAMVPICMRFGLHYGFKKVFSIGNAIFYVGSLFVALSPNFPIVMISRIIAGIGAGIILNFCIALIAQSFPKNLVPLALCAYTAFGFGMGYVIGSFIGGYFAQYVVWQMIFYFTFFIGFIPLALIWLFYHETEPRPINPFDTLGFGSFILFISSLMILAMNVKAPWNTQGWHSTFTHLCYVVIAVSLFGLVFFELKNPKPMLLLKHFGIRPFTLGCISIFFIGCVLFGTSIVFPIMLFDGLKWPLAKIGIYMMSFGVFIGIAGTLVGLLSQKIGIRIPTFIGLALICISCFMQHSFTIYSDHMDLFWVLCIRGFGIGASLGPVTALAIYRIEENEVAKATVSVTICRQLGAALGSNILTIIATQRLAFHQERFGSMVNPDSPMYQSVYRKILLYYEKLLGSNPTLANEQTSLYIGDYLDRQALVASYDDAFFVMGIILLVITLILGFLMSLHFFKSLKKSKQPA